MTLKPCISDPGGGPSEDDLVFEPVSSMILSQPTEIHSWSTNRMQPSINHYQKTKNSQTMKKKQINLSPELLTRPSWIDAQTAIEQIEKNKAFGNLIALRLRQSIQIRLNELGSFIWRKPGSVLFVASLILVVFTVLGLKSVKIENNVEKLWIEEGGRVEKELQYIRKTLGEGHGITNQIIIQTVKSQTGSVLHPHSLLLHLQIMRTAIQTNIEMFDLNWNLKDICYTHNSPNFDTHHLDSLLENIFPCSIITPLDCFWEGSKLLGPEIPVTVPNFGINIHWTSFNPKLLLDTIVETFKQSISLNEKNSQQHNLRMLDTIRRFMSKAGITTAYQTKPCLDPLDLNCPSAAPNHLARKVVNIGEELTGGCYGFATKYMHWLEDLIVGGVQRNRSGTIVKAKALQSIIQLMGEQNMYEYYSQTYKVHNIDWTVDKARAILQAWQRKFSHQIQQLMASTDFVGSKQYDVTLFTSTSLTEVMQDFAQINCFRLILGYLIMLFYAAFSLFQRSQTLLGMMGVLLISLSVASGMGVCALIGLPFNASTTQIIPFLALALGIDNMFILAHFYASAYMIKYVPFELRTQETLKQTGPSILLSSIGCIISFLSASIIPIPALRCFAFQTAILILLVSLIVILLFPAVASIELRFQRNHSQFEHNLPSTHHHHPHQSSSFIMKLCWSLCSLSSSNNPSHLQVSSLRELHLFELSSGKSSTLNSQHVKNIRNQQSSSMADSIHRTHMICFCDSSFLSRRKSSKHCEQCGGELRTQCDGQDEKAYSEFKENIRSFLDNPKHEENLQHQTSMKKFLRTSYLIEYYYGPFLQLRSVKVFVLFFYLTWLVISILGAFKVRDGLDLVDLVPRDTMEYRFLEFRKRYFSFYNVFAVTKGNFDYPNNQKLLIEFHQSFNRIDSIIKNDDGGLPEFWLTMFRDWLIDLQSAFDQDFSEGCITRENWFANASNEGILAYKLLVQTGRVDNPVDKSLVLTSRLVDDQGIINSRAFYNYLTAWASNDPMAYDSSQASLKPEPRHWIHVPQDVELKIPKSQPLVFAQIPFNLNNIRNTEEIISTIKNMREISDRFQERGLPNFPTGIPFTYWEQYIHLRFYIILALIVVFLCIFLIVGVVLWNAWISTILVSILAINVTQLFGFIGWLGIKLSAVPALILIVSVGISLKSLVHIIMSFQTGLGNRNRRMVMALQHMSTPVKHGIVSSFFGILMLAFSEFDFIVRYFFYVLGGFLLILTINCFVLLPIVLAIIGPNPEVLPIEHHDRISTPSPPSSPSFFGRKHYLEALMLETRDYASSRFASNKPAKKKDSFIRKFHRSSVKRNNSLYSSQRVQSLNSLSTISEEPSSYEMTPEPPNPSPSCHHEPILPCQPSAVASSPSHEFVVQPEFVVETTITNNNPSISNGFGSRARTSLRSTSENGSISPMTATNQSTSSETDTSDRDSPSSDNDDRSGSAASFTTTTTTTSVPNAGHDPLSTTSTTVTTKVMATAKLTLIPPPSHFQHQPSTALNSSIMQPLVSFPGANNYHQPYHSAGGFHYIPGYYPAYNAQSLHQSTHQHLAGCVNCPNATEQTSSRFSKSSNRRTDQRTTMQQSVNRH